MSRFSIVLVLCSIVSFAFAQSDPAKKQPGPQAVAPAASAPVKEKPAVAEKGVAKVMAGPIASIDQTKKTISVNVKSGTYPVSIDEKTVLRAGDKQIAFADLKKGDRVHVEYQKLSNGQRKAVLVTTAAQKPAPEAKAQPVTKQEAAAPKAEPAPAQKAEAAKPAPAKAELAPVTKAEPVPKAQEAAPVQKR